MVTLQPLALFPAEYLPYKEASPESGGPISFGLMMMSVPSPGLFFAMPIA
jgi:hypothetical protein